MIFAAAIVFSGSIFVKAQEEVSGIKVGTSDQNDVLKKLGNDYELITYETYSRQLKYKKLGLSFYYCQDDPKQIIFSIEVRMPFKGAVGKGIVVGKSQVKDVFRLYGRPIEEISPPWLEYAGIDFRNVDLETGEINSLNDEMLINEINIYAPGFTFCDEPSSDLKAK